MDRLFEMFQPAEFDVANVDLEGAGSVVFHGVERLEIRHPDCGVEYWGMPRNRSGEDAVVYKALYAKLGTSSTSQRERMVRCGP